MSQLRDMSNRMLCRSMEETHSVGEAITDSDDDMGQERSRWQITILEEFNVNVKHKGQCVQLTRKKTNLPKVKRGVEPQTDEISS